MKVAILKINGKPFGICEIKDWNTMSIVNIQKEIEQNVEEYYSVISKLENRIKELVNQVEDLQKDIKILKGEE